MDYWLAIGPPNNWKIGVKKKLWAVNPRNSKSWERVQPGDTVCFYATAPVKGIIGYGTVKKTRVDEKPFWPEEVKAGHTMWPFQIQLQEIKALPLEEWELKRLIPERKGIVFQRAFQPVDEKRSRSWMKKLPI